jgi:serine/threonine-protein kinase
VFEPIASGGMATVHFGRLLGPSGFSRTVAIKRLHPQYASVPEVAAMFLDEARVAARLRHPNVVSVIDVIAEGDEVLLVMEYVHGESLAYLVRGESTRDPRRVLRVANVVAGALCGLHAAHEATGENLRPLGVVHRDFSPQNILVGVDGTPRLLDFGVAKAEGQRHCSNAGMVKGKVRFLSPEQVRCHPVDRRTDLWAASIVLWESLTGKRLFSSEDVPNVLAQILEQPIPSPHEIAPEVPEALARVVMRGLQRDPDARFSSALEMAAAIEDAVGLVPPREIGAWVERVARVRLEERRRALDVIEAEDVTELSTPSSSASFAAVTDHAMVQVATEERATIPAKPARKRVPAIVWGACAALVAAIAGGAGARLFGGEPASGVSSGAPTPPVVLSMGAEPSTTCLEAASTATTAVGSTDAPAPFVSALPTTSVRAAVPARPRATPVAKPTSR